MANYFVFDHRSEPVFGLWNQRELANIYADGRVTPHDWYMI